MYVLCMYTNYYSVDMFLLCMTKVRVRWCSVVCGECYITLGKLFKSVVLFTTPYYFVFENSNLISYTQNELARPVMGTIFLVNQLIHYENTGMDHLCILDVRISVLYGWDKSALGLPPPSIFKGNNEQVIQML